MKSGLLELVAGWILHHNCIPSFEQRKSVRSRNSR
jgi:hypothetical protein